MVQFVPVDAPGSMGALKTITSAIWQKMVDDLQLHQNVQAILATNDTGAGVGVGYVGVLDDTTANSLVPGIASDTRRVVVVQDTAIASTLAGYVVCLGKVDVVNVTGAVALHSALEMSATPGRAHQGTGAPFAVALTAFAGPGNGTVSALLLPPLMAGGAFPLGLPSPTHGPVSFHINDAALHAAVIAAPAAGTSIYITSARVQNNNTTPSVMSLFDATGPLHTENLVLAGVQGAGVEATYDPPWEVGAADALDIQQTAAADVYGTINFYVAAAS